MGFRKYLLLQLPVPFLMVHLIITDSLSVIFSAIPFIILPQLHFPHIVNVLLKILFFLNWYPHCNLHTSHNFLVITSCHFPGCNTWYDLKANLDLFFSVLLNCFVCIRLSNSFLLNIISIILYSGSSFDESEVK